MDSENKNFFKMHNINTGYYVSEMPRLDYAGSAIINALQTKDLFTQEFQFLHKKLPKIQWHMVDLNELFENIHTDFAGAIVVSSRAKAYQKAIQEKYPQAKVMAY